MDAGVVRRVTAALAADPACGDDAARVEELRALEELTCAAQARQAALAVALTASKATALQVGLARRESHHRGRRHLGLARVVYGELPHTWAAWRTGRVSQWRVTLIARETGCLTRLDRQRIDAELAGDPDRLAATGDRELIGHCRARAAALDPASVVARRRKAEADRTVTVRPAPDCMVYLTGLLPVAEGVAAYAAWLDRPTPTRDRDPATSSTSSPPPATPTGPERRRHPDTPARATGPTERLLRDLTLVV